EWTIAVGLSTARTCPSSTVVVARAVAHYAPMPRKAAGPPATSPRATLKTLADHLGLSPASISLVLNGATAARAIPRHTQDRIREAARRFHYRPNSLARSLRRQRSFTVGVMVPEVSEGYAATVMSGIEDSLLQAGYLY